MPTKLTAALDRPQTEYRWTRRELADDTSEILTLVRVDGRDGYFVEICAGPEIGDDFVGLFWLDGTRVDLGNCTWAPVQTAPRSVITQIESDWESGTTVVERFAEGQAA